MTDRKGKSKVIDKKQYKPQQRSEEYCKANQPRCENIANTRRKIYFNDRISKETRMKELSKYFYLRSLHLGKKISVLIFLC